MLGGAVALVKVASAGLRSGRSKGLRHGDWVNNGRHGVPKTSRNSPEDSLCGQRAKYSANYFIEFQNQLQQIKRSRLTLKSVIMS